MRDKYSNMEDMNLDADSDEGDGVFKLNASNGLSHDAMVFNTNMKHPRD